MESNNQPGLGGIPGEIWVNIFEVHQLRGHLSGDNDKHHERCKLDTLLNISLTCKGFNLLVRPILYRTLDFKIHSSRAGLNSLLDTLVDDSDVWQYVRQIRVSRFVPSDDFSGLDLGTGTAGEKKPKLLSHLEKLAISPDLMHDIVQDNLRPDVTYTVVAAVLLCLCRNVHVFDMNISWRDGKVTGISPLLKKIFSERSCKPDPAAIQAHPELLLDRRPCADIRSIRIFRGKSIEIDDLGAFLELPSMLSFDMSCIYSTAVPRSTYKHLNPVPSWNLQSLKISECTVNACLVSDVLRACKQLRFLDLDVRHTPGRPAFLYDHMGAFMMRHNRKLEVLICRDYKVHNRVGFLDGKNTSLQALDSLRKLVLPLSVIWNVNRPTTVSFEDILPTSLKDLRIIAASPGRPDEGDMYAQSFLRLMESQQHSGLKSIRIGELEPFAKPLSLELESNPHGWTANWDAETKEHVYTRDMNAARQVGGESAGMSIDMD